LLISLVMGALGACVFAFPEELLRLFLPKDAARVEHLKDAAVSAAVPSLRFTGLIAPIVAAALVLTQALYGAGESRFVAVVEAVLHFGCLVPLAWIFAVTLGWGLIGCWYATAVYAVLLLGATAWRFASGRWKALVL
jgi:MATE family multidrug resistance protein